MTAKEIICKEYGDSRNFMTPEILGRGLLPGGAYELSTGSGFDHESIYGVSVVWLNPDGTTERAKQPISQMFHSLETARDHIRHLKWHSREAQKSIGKEGHDVLCTYKERGRRTPAEW